MVGTFKEIPIHNRRFDARLIQKYSQMSRRGLQPHVDHFWAIHDDQPSHSRNKTDYEIIRLGSQRYQQEMLSP